MLKSKLPDWGVRVPKGGFEPPRVFTHYALNVARLPVSPLRRANDVIRSYGVYFILFFNFVNLFLWHSTRNQQATML